MAENVVTGLSEDFLHCTICTNTYNEPKMLPCLHSFCLQCLEQRASSDREQPFLCPTCKCEANIPISGVGRLPGNVFLVDLMERMEKVRRLYRKNQIDTCYVCKSDAGILFCLECLLRICKSCKEIHDRFTRSDDHPLIPSEKMSDESYLTRIMSKQAPYCNAHKQENVQYYCKQCSQLACKVCLAVSHQGHQGLQEIMSKVETIKATYETLLEKNNGDLKEVLDKSKETLRATESIKKQVSELRCKIDDRFEELVTKLQTDKKKLQTELEGIKNRGCAKWKSIDQNLSEQISKIETFQKMTRTILEQENPWEMLEMEKSIVESYKRLGQDKRSTKQSISRTALAMGSWKGRYEYKPAHFKVIGGNDVQKYKSNNALTTSPTMYLDGPYFCTNNPREMERERIRLEEQLETLNEELKKLKLRDGLLKHLSKVNILGAITPKT